jgi:predicted Zn-dependent protease
MLGIFWLLASGALLQGAPQSAPSPLAEAYFLFLEGRTLEGRGDVEGAVRAYRKAIELAPGAADVHAELAGLYARQGRASESIGEARTAIAIDPDNREAHRMIGFVLATVADQRGDGAMRDEAIGHFESALVANVRDPAVELTIGRLAVRSGRYPLAIRWLTTFRLDQTGFPEAMELLAEAYEGSGRPAEAADVVTELLAQSPEQVRLRSWLAELYESASAWSDAASVWEELASASPGGVVYPMRRAMALVNGGDIENGRRALRDLTKQAPDNIRVWYLLSQVERRAGDATAALDAAERIRTLDPDSAFGVLALAEARMAAGDPAGAATALEARVSAARADDIETGMFARMSSALAMALQESGETGRAVSVLEAATARVPQDEGLRFELGAAYDRDRRFDAAERVFREMIAGDPAQADALNYLGYLLADRGERLDEAVSLIRRALDVERDNPSYLDSLGWAYFRLGDFAQAQAPLERAAAALPRTSVIQDHLGDLYLQMKRYREAVSAFDRALAGDRIGIDSDDVSRKRDRARELAGGR